MCNYTISVLCGAINRTACYSQSAICHINVKLSSRPPPQRNVPDTIPNILASHPPIKSVCVTISSCSTPALATLSYLVAALPLLSSAEIHITAVIPSPIPTIRVSPTIIALRYSSSTPSGFALIRQFAHHATHIRAPLSSLLLHPPFAWLPSIIYLRVDVITRSEYDKIEFISPLIQHCHRLRALCIYTPNESWPHLTIHHPNLRHLSYMNSLTCSHDGPIRPNSILPNLSPDATLFPLVHFNPATSYIHSHLPSAKAPLGHLIASFLLSIRRISPSIDPLPVLSHLTHLDAVVGPETPLYDIRPPIRFWQYYRSIWFPPSFFFFSS